MKLLTYGRLLPIVMFTLTIASCHDTDDEDDNNKPSADVNVNANPTVNEPALARLEFPRVKGGNSVVLIHTTNDQYGINYSVEWDCDKKSQRWSAYQMTSATLAQSTSRYRSDTNQYPFDPLLTSNQYLTKDCFWNTGYDHGHICPSADRLYSYEANYQTFFLTNMQPQTKAFNASENSPWYRLENQVRTWTKAVSTEVLYVVKGGTIEDDQILCDNGGNPIYLRGEMLVPKYFFVALLLKNKEGYKAVGFWMEHKDSYNTYEGLGTWAVNIDELEQKTGIDFFCNLPDDTENRIESLPIENVKRAWGL